MPRKFWVHLLYQVCTYLLSSLREILVKNLLPFVCPTNILRADLFWYWATSNRYIEWSKIFVKLLVKCRERLETLSLEILHYVLNIDRFMYLCNLHIVWSVTSLKVVLNSRLMYIALRMELCILVSVYHYINRMIS